MNKDLIRSMLGRLSEDEQDRLGHMLIDLTVDAIDEAEDSIEDGREREVYELGKQIGVLEHFMEEYEKF